MFRKRSGLGCSLFGVRHIGEPAEVTALPKHAEAAQVLVIGLEGFIRNLG
jgi:hypothetical protein